jgi:hypothetical protein
MHVGDADIIPTSVPLEEPPHSLGYYADLLEVPSSQLEIVLQNWLSGFEAPRDRSVEAGDRDDLKLILGYRQALKGFNDESV